MDYERKRFEACVRRYHSAESADFLLKKHGDVYANWLTQRDWDTWQRCISFVLTQEVVI